MSVVNWTAAVATLIAAFTIAANLGARITGWGFVGYVMASALWIWSQTTATEPDTSVVFMHSVLLVVNLFGAWRWYLSGLTGRPATSGEVMLSALPVLVGCQLLISAVNFDIANVPSAPLHPSLAARGQGTSPLEAFRKK